jgi:hypothetical protein
MASFRCFQSTNSIGFETIEVHASVARLSSLSFVIPLRGPDQRLPGHRYAAAWMPYSAE